MIAITTSSSIRVKARLIVTKSPFAAGSACPYPENNKGRHRPYQRYRWCRPPVCPVSLTDGRRVKLLMHCRTEMWFVGSTCRKEAYFAAYPDFVYQLSRL